jgi:hypothetical protein
MLCFEGIRSSWITTPRRLKICTRCRCVWLYAAATITPAKGSRYPALQKAGWTPKPVRSFTDVTNPFVLPGIQPRFLDTPARKLVSHFNIKAHQDGTVHRPMQPLYNTLCRLLQYSRSISDRLVHINGLFRFILRFLHSSSYYIR